MIKIERSEAEDLWPRCAEIIFEKLTDADNNRKRTLTFLSGGSAVSLYSLLSEKLKKAPLHPRRHVFAQADERFQPENKNDINAYQIEKSGLPQSLREKNIAFHAIPQRETLMEAQDNYRLTINRLFNISDIKIAVLGIGEDGHTAGLLPGYMDKWDTQSLVAGYENSGGFPQRISLTPQAISRCGLALVVLSGKSKQPVLQRLLDKKENDLNKFPAEAINSISEVKILTDFPILH
ncbi:MAG: 6-phosphogluconolactonase, 6-phosphogluconolactonase [Candidatus Gottesmanbacteria bacterium GW2011_GWA2_43_14]|uniref:6-phosphogluconolactonase, 6-phosphogluconolactonase n=1 Tax=Candidatus Gottesmanbacteria bacterium GW2011_GWA2_43_14 TaxID=1618443 RepID=A0A0G1DJ45_9BACT|nr:MAG: 6-phosphogluconolactonase, 6-phosphogluconolactonase [Candidatus Gottesmanbacteria bacterium GW2011_GWA2_43_14]